jgi:hypothetical protein
MPANGRQGRAHFESHPRGPCNLDMENAAANTKGPSMVNHHPENLTLR